MLPLPGGPQCASSAPCSCSSKGQLAEAAREPIGIEFKVVLDSLPCLQKKAIWSESDLLTINWSNRDLPHHGPN